MARKMETYTYSEMLALSLSQAAAEGGDIKTKMTEMIDKVAQLYEKTHPGPRLEDMVKAINARVGSDEVKELFSGVAGRFSFKEIPDLGTCEPTKEFEWRMRVARAAVESDAERPMVPFCGLEFSLWVSGNTRT